MEWFESEDFWRDFYPYMFPPEGFAAAKEGLDEGGDQPWGELHAGILDSKHHAVGVGVGRNPDGAAFRQGVDDRVVHEVRSQLQQERV